MAAQQNAVSMSVLSCLQHTVKVSEQLCALYAAAETGSFPKKKQISKRMLHIVYMAYAVNIISTALSK